MIVPNSTRSILRLVLDLVLQEKSHSLNIIHNLLHIISQIQILTCTLIFSLKYLSFDQQELIGKSIIGVLKPIILDDSIYYGSQLTSVFKLYIVVMLVYYTMFIGFGCIIVILFYRKIKIPKSYAVVYKILYNLNLDVFFLPFLSLQYSMINYSYSVEPFQTGILGKQFLYEMGVVLLVFNVIVSFFGSLFNFDPWIHGNLQATRPSSLGAIDFIFKVEIFIGYALSSPVIGKWFTLIIQIILLVSKLYLILNKYPYFNYIQSIITFSLTALSLESCLVNIVLTLFDAHMSISSTFIWLILSPASIAFAYRIIKNRVEHTLELKHKELNVYSALQKLSLIQHIFAHGSYSFRTKGNRIYKTGIELQFSAMVFKHRSNCKDKQCFCQIFNSKGEDEISMNHPEEIEEKLAKFTYQYTKKFLEKAIASNPKNNIWLKISLIQHIIKKRPDQAVVALSVLHSINQTKLSHFEQFILQKIIESIQRTEVNRSKGEGEIDLAKIVYYKDDIESFRKKLGQITEMTVGFWEMLQSGNVKVSSLLSLTYKSNHEDDKLRVMWEKLVARHSSFLYKDYLLYAGFLTTIRNCEKEGRAIFKMFEKLTIRLHQAQKMFDKISSKNLNDDKNLFLTVSLSKRSLGTIKQVHGKGAMEIVGWSTDDLMGASINMIIPPHFREKHDFIMSNHLDDGNNEKLQTNLLVYALKKNGFINPVYIYLTMADNITQELNYAAVLRPARVPYDYLLIWNDGRIINCTEKIAAELRITDKSLNSIKIQDICVEFEEIFKIYHTINCMRKIKKFRDIRHIEYSRIKDYLEELELDPKFSSPKSEVHLATMIEIYSMCIDKSILLTFQSLKAVTTANTMGVSFNCKFFSEPTDNSDIIYIQLTRVSLKKIKNKNLKRQDSKKSKFSQKSIRDEVSQPDYSHSKISAILRPKALKDNYVSKSNHNSMNDSAFLSHASEGLSDEYDDPPTALLQDLGVKQIELSAIKPAIESIENGIDATIPKIVVDAIQKHSDSSINTLNFMKKKVNETDVDYDAVHKLENEDDDESDGIIDDLDISKAGSDDIFYDLIKTGQIGASVAGGSQTQSVNSFYSNVSELESIISRPAKDHRMKVLFYILTLYFIAITVGFIVFTNRSTTLIETAASTSEVIRTTTLRTFNLIELDRRVRCSNLVQRGFLPKIKSGRGVSDYSLFCLLKAQNHTLQLQNLTVNMSNAIGGLDMNMLPEFKEVVQLKPVNPIDPVLNVTLDGAIASIISASIRLLIQGKKGNVTENNSDMKFILSNMLNDILEHSEKIPTALLNYIKKTNDTVINYLTIITILVAVITIVMSSISLYVELSFIKEKRWFILGIIHMDEKLYVDYVKKIRVFMRVIRERGIIIQHNNTVEMFSTMGRRSEKKTAHKISRVNFHGFSRSTYMRIFSLIATLIVVFIIQVVMLGMFQSFNDDFITANENLIISDNMLIHYSLTFGAMYEYISDNLTTTIRNRPIVSEIQTEFEFLKNNTDFYKIFYTPGGYIPVNSTVWTILNGDLCERYIATLSSPTLCPGMANGAGQRGLKNINSYLLATFNAMKLSYDFSGKMYQDQWNSLNLKMLRESETIMGNSFITPYTELDGILTEIIKAKIVDYNYNTQNINIVAIVIGILIILLVNQLVYKHVLNERYHLKRALKLVPVYIMMDNAKLRSFLKNSTEYL